MRGSTLTRLIAVAAVGALLAGCTSGTPQSGSDAGNSEGPVPEVEAQDVTLDPYRTILQGEGDLSDDDYLVREQKLEELVAECMTEQGFEYVAYASEADAGSTEPDWDSLEFAEQYGYGFIDWPGADEEFEGASETDPNETYLDSLSESELADYYAALWGADYMDAIFGDFDEDDFTYESEAGDYLDLDEYVPEDLAEDDLPDDLDLDEDYEYRWEDNGCWGWADHQLGDDDEDADALWDDQELAELSVALDEAIEQAYESDPDLLAVEDEWAACMKGAGYPNATVRQAALSDLLPEISELLEQEEAGLGQELSEDRLRELQSQEIAVATADWKCTDQVGYRARVDAAQVRAENAFASENKEALDALLEKYGEGQN